MADELTLKITFNYNPSVAGEVAITPSEFSGAFDVSASAPVATGTQVFTAAVEDTLDVLGATKLVTNPGYLMLKNISSADFVEYNSLAAPAGAVYTGKLNAGEFCVLRLGDLAADLNFLADTSSQTIQFWLLGD